jgi:hypothetical protein
MSGAVLRRPLAAGDPITYWQLGATAEARYDVPDQPMAGAMDPFFFLTRHKNFIPHEYPCRTRFAAERRGKRPDPIGTFAPMRNWLPFGAPRVDLSGFWFRPTTLGTWARAVLIAATAGTATLALETCGGAVLFVNGREVGWVAGYVRNLPERRALAVDLEAGANALTVYFDDLAERDARYFFQLDYVAGPGADQALRVSVDGAIAAQVEAALDQMHFERPTWTDGTVALRTASPVPAGAEVTVSVAGSVLAPGRFERRMRLDAAADRLAIADTASWPAGFHHATVAIALGEFVASRPFGVEISHGARQGAAPAELSARVAEALSEVAAHAASDTVRALARLATGQGGRETDAMILAMLRPIEDCHDCADFLLVPLIWCRTKFADAIAPDVALRIDRAILSYRYWMDEPGNDVQWYFSENHALLFHTAAYLAGDLLPGQHFVRSGRTGADQSKVGRDRVRAWLDHFATWEMAEFNSAPYFPIDLKGLTALLALAPDADIREQARAAIVRLIAIVARSAHHGVLTAAQGRSYEHTLCAGRALELSGIARLLWGTGSYGHHVHALPLLALCLRDHALTLPPELQEIACWRRDDVQEWAQEWCFAQGQDRTAKLYHYKTAAYAIGTAARYRWNEWGYQETVLHLRLGEDPDAQIWINHPGEAIHAGHGRPSYWGGSGTLPRVHHYRGLAVMLFDVAAEQPDFTHAWFPRFAFDVASVDGAVALAQRGAGLALLKASGPLQLVATGPTAGSELRLAGRKAAWIVRLGDTARDGTAAEFAAVFSGLALREGAAGTLQVEDPEYGTVTFHDDGRIEAEDRIIDPAQWTIAGEARRLALAPPRGTPAQPAQ